MKMKRKGIHILLELFGCNAKLLDDSIFIKKVFFDAIEKSGLKKVEKGFRIYKFDKQGLTAFALLKTSHISIHTWPEYNFCALDIFTCDNNEKAYIAEKIFLDYLKPKKVKRIVLRRGYKINAQN